MKSCGKEGRVAFAIGVPLKVCYLGVDKMMRGNMFKSRHPPLIFEKFEDGDISCVGHHSKIWASREEMKVEDSRFIRLLLNECSGMVRTV